MQLCKLVTSTSRPGEKYNYYKLNVMAVSGNIGSRVWSASASVSRTAPGAAVKSQRLRMLGKRARTLTTARGRAASVNRPISVMVLLYVPGRLPWEGYQGTRSRKQQRGESHGSVWHTNKHIHSTFTRSCLLPFSTDSYVLYNVSRSWQTSAFDIVALLITLNKWLTHWASAWEW